MRRPPMSTERPTRLEAHRGGPVEVGAPADEKDQHRGADEGGDDPDGHLLGSDDGAGQQVAHHHERGAEEHADGQHPAVIGADQEPDDVGHDQTDESDDPAHGHRHADHERGDDEEVPAHAVHVDPERGRRLRPHRQRVERSALGQQDSPCPPPGRWPGWATGSSWRCRTSPSSQKSTDWVAWGLPRKIRKLVTDSKRAESTTPHKMS